MSLKRVKIRRTKTNLRFHKITQILIKPTGQNQTGHKTMQILGKQTVQNPANPNKPQNNQAVEGVKPQGNQQNRPNKNKVPNTKPAVTPADTQINITCNC
jgi:hypothetical protein